MKLELKHLAPYLPYGLKVSKIHVMHSHTGIGSIDHVLHSVNKGKSQYKPILRPLSDLLKNDSEEVGTWVSIDDFDVNKIEYRYLQVLLKYHFDIFGLIEQGLAIDINTLE